MKNRDLKWDFNTDSESLFIQLLKTLLRFIFESHFLTSPILSEEVK